MAVTIWTYDTCRQTDDPPDFKACQVTWEYDPEEPGETRTHTIVQHAPCIHHTEKAGCLDGDHPVHQECRKKNSARGHAAVKLFGPPPVPADFEDEADFLEAMDKWMRQHNRITHHHDANRVLHLSIPKHLGKHKDAVEKHLADNGHGDVKVVHE